MTKAIHRAGGFIAAVALSACVSGGGGAVDQVSLDPLETTIGMGTAAGQTPASGLPFASAGDDVRDLETIPVTVRMGRVSRDRTTGAVTIFVADETVTLSDGFYEGFYEPSSFTLDGEIYDLASGSVTINGTIVRQTDREYSNVTTSAARHELAIVTSGSPDVFHEYGVFIMGFETDPSALPAGTVSYAGQFNTDAWPSRNGGTPSNNYTTFNGTLRLDVDFGTPQLSGSFEGKANFTDNGYVFNDNVFGTIPTTALTGNGFEAPMLFTECLGATSCTSNMTIGGAVYGADAGRIAGLVMTDATFVRESDEVTMRLLGPGVFYADRTE